MSKVYLLVLSACPPRLSKQKRMQWSLNSCAVLRCEAIKQEATGLQDVGVWDSSTVREKAEVAAQARQSGIKVHFGQLMTIASIKFYELAKHLQKVKGRVVCRGDCAKDEAGAPVYQELGANPTSVQGLNACLAYGCVPGHTVTTADAVKAYVQAFLSLQFQTWIELPP